MALQSNGNLSSVCLDSINVFGEMKKDCIRVVLLVNISLHLLFPLFTILYERGSGDMWYYDENGNYVESHYNKSSIRQ